jgi:hypothetical protein
LRNWHRTAGARDNPPVADRPDTGATMREHPVVYVAGPEADAQTALAEARAHGLGVPVPLRRRGTHLGWIAARPGRRPVMAGDAARAWAEADAYPLPGLVRAALPAQREAVAASLALAQAVAGGDDPSALLAAEPYLARTGLRFELLAGFQDEGDEQEIETVEYDAVDGGEVVGENLWCKASWLSFEEDDASLRFRFSFGLAGFEDVAADLPRELHAAGLCEAVFPESVLVSRNPDLEALLRQVVDRERIAFVERIVYFNAPNGGAQFHQDVERGHLGVVFAQVHGRTGWLACSKARLVEEIRDFVADPAHQAGLDTLLPDPAMAGTLRRRCADPRDLGVWLDQDDNEPLERLLNRSPAFCRHLVARGYGYLVETGDVLLLPQGSLDHCAWHTVFCLDDFPGESLSFAVRGID